MMNDDDSAISLVGSIRTGNIEIIDADDSSIPIDKFGTER
jgi:hypothetical protein